MLLQSIKYSFLETLVMDAIFRIEEDVEHKKSVACIFRNDIAVILCSLR